MSLPDWWRSREPRERVVLIVGGFTAALLLGYALVGRPVIDFHRELILEVEQHRQDLAWMQRAAADLIRLQRTRPDREVRKVSPLIAVQEAATAVGIEAALTSLETDANGGVRVRLQGVQLERALAWLQTLGRRYAVGVERLVLEPAGPPGLATISVRLLARAGNDGAGAKDAAVVGTAQRRRLM